MERLTGSDLLTEQVVEMIEREELAVGDRLPSVQALAGRFSVAGPTMREVLRRLQAIGVVEIRHGSGVYVRRAGRQVVLPNPYPGRLRAETLIDLLDARLLIEPHLAELTAGRADDAAIAELDELLERAATLLEGTEDAELTAANMSFHRGVARRAGNTVLGQVIDSLLDLYLAEQMEIQRIYDDRRRDHEEHVSIIEAIRARDPALARARMRRHLEGVREVIGTRVEDRAGAD